MIYKICQGLSCKLIKNSTIDIILEQKNRAFLYNLTAIAQAGAQNPRNHRRQDSALCRYIPCPAVLRARCADGRNKPLLYRSGRGCRECRDS